MKEWWCVKPDRACRKERIAELGILEANVVASPPPRLVFVFIFVNPFSQQCFHNRIVKAYL